MASAPPAGIRPTTYLPELESLRGVAILLVVAFHADAMVRAKGMRPPGDDVSLPLAFVRAGHSGVDLFFVLSAFLLSLPFLAEMAGGRRVSVRAFYKRRALRILPMYWLVVVLSTVLIARTPADLLNGVPFLFFVRPPGMLLVPFSIAWWSLATEVQFYLVLPLLAVYARSSTGRWLVSGLLLSYVALHIAFLAGVLKLAGLDRYLWMSTDLIGRGPLFLWGIAAAWVYQRHGLGLRTRWQRTAWIRRGGGDVALWATVAAIGVVLQWVVARGPWDADLGWWHAWHVQAGALWAIFILLMLLAPLHTKRIFDNRALAAVGEWSYSLYLVHAPVISVSLAALRGFPPRTHVGWDATNAVYMAAVVTACMALSVLTYRFVERPFLVRKARVVE